MSIKTHLIYLSRKLPIRLRCWLFSIYSNGRVNIGRGSLIHSSVHMLGKNNIKIGYNTCISEGCWLNVNHRLKDKISIEIGNNCFIGKGNFFSSGHKITIADYTLTTINCKFIGSSHVVDNPLMPYITSGTTSDFEISIGINCFIGAGATVIGNVNIGHGSIIGAESLVLQDIAPFSMAVGNPCRIIKRFSFRSNSWINTEEFTIEDESLLPNTQEYLNILSQSYPIVRMPWIAAGKNLGDL